MLFFAEESKTRPDARRELLENFASVPIVPPPAEAARCCCGYLQCKKIPYCRPVLCWSITTDALTLTNR